MMKKLVLFWAVIIPSNHLFADSSISALAKWDVSAMKDTSSALVVTPLSSLDFKYIAGLKSFNSVTGAFDISIANQESAKDFNIAVKILSNTLVRNKDLSTLAVGAYWNGQKLSNNMPLVIFDSSLNNRGSLKNLLKTNDNSKPTSVQDNFIFNIDSATLDGNTKTDFAALQDGRWEGQVAVQFTATWAHP